MASFKIGARGLCVRELQELLQIKVDGVFGARETAPAIVRTQKAHNLIESGEADAQLYEVLGSTFPDLFRRCLGLTNAFEGTYYSDCNAEDIDNAGLTMGIIGFTSAHGEVQEILRNYYQRRTSMTSQFSGERRGLFESLLTTITDASAWGKFFYGPAFVAGQSKGLPVISDVIAAIKEWGYDTEMRTIQLERAARYWAHVPIEVAELGLDMGSEAETNAAHALLFDTHVQNGSLRSEHRQVFTTKCNHHPEATTVRAKLQFLAEAIAECAKSEWRVDVLARKSLFASGSGVVHGTRYTLEAQALV